MTPGIPAPTAAGASSRRLDQFDDRPDHRIGSSARCVALGANDDLMLIVHEPDLDVGAPDVDPGDEHHVPASTSMAVRTIMRDAGAETVWVGMLVPRFS